MALVVGRHRSDERDLVLRSTTSLAACALASGVLVVYLNRARETILSFTSTHNHHKIVANQLSRRVADADMALALQCGQSGLGLADEVDRMKPRRQRQLSGSKQRSGGNRGLAPEGVTLKQGTPAAEDNAVSSTATIRVMKVIRPTGPAHGFDAGLFSAKGAKEFSQRHFVLELDQVGKHGIYSLMRYQHHLGQVAHSVS